LAGFRSAGAERVCDAVKDVERAFGVRYAATAVTGVSGSSSGIGAATDQGVSQLAAQHLQSRPAQVIISAADGPVLARNCGPTPERIGPTADAPPGKAVSLRPKRNIRRPDLISILGDPKSPVSPGTALAQNRLRL